MSTIADRQITAQELFEHPEWESFELVRGRLVFRKLNSAQHGWIAGNVFAALYNFVRAIDAGVVFMTNTGVILERDPDTVRGPDGMFLSKHRIPSDGIPEGYLTSAPDLAFEIVSPEDRFSELTEKVESYLAAGTRLVWVIDPNTERAHVFQQGRNVISLDHSQPLSGEDVLPGFLLKVADIYRD